MKVYFVWFGEFFPIPIKQTVLLKETVSRDFRPLVFFHQSTAPRPLINTIKKIFISFRFCGDTYSTVKARQF
jgi:hypothetical protein